MINRFDGDGILLETNGGNVIRGSYLGTDVTGTIDMGNGSGVAISGGQSNMIGGTTAEEGNIISGNGYGIALWEGPNTNNTVSRNFIGTDVTGTQDLGNGWVGIFIAAGAESNSIGGTAADAGNVIAFNLSNGIAVASGTRTSISSNHMFANGGIGIDLGDDGVTPNDADDADVGANNLQNFPDFALAEIDLVGDLMVEYSVDSALANSTYPLRVEFFIADVDSEEGDTYDLVDAQSPKLANLGNAAVLGVAENDLVVSTATDDLGNTSEFSANITVTGVPVPLLCNGVEATIAGTDGDDILVGTEAADVIVARDGDDFIVALGGNDTVCGGPGNDVMSGGQGRDRLFGESGDDMLDGGADDDGLVGGDDNDMIAGRDGDDRINCGAGTDSADGGLGADQAAPNCEFTVNIP